MRKDTRNVGSVPRDSNSRSTSRVLPGGRLGATSAAVTTSSRALTARAIPCFSSDFASCSRTFTYSSTVSRSDAPIRPGS